jgi:hypothetical protein
MEFKNGVVNNPSHLKVFDMELAKQGYPLAGATTGNEVRYLRPVESGPRANGSFLYAYDLWITREGGVVHPQWKTNCQALDTELHKYIALAPLSVVEGKGLHVGDVIELDMINYFGKWHKHIASLEEYKNGLYKPEMRMWRWPIEKELTSSPP